VTQPAQTHSFEAADRPSHGYWIAPAVLVVFLVVALIVMLIPGVRLFPDPGVVAFPDRSPRHGDPEAASQLTAALERQRDALRERLDSGVCEMPEGMATGSGGAVDGDVDGSPGSAADGSDTPAQPRQWPEGMVSPGLGPESLPTPDAGSDADAEGSGSLADRITAATVLLLGETGMGSGFFLSDRLVATNHHVVGDAPGVTMHVTGQAMSGIIPARVVARTPNSEPGGADFALLELAEPAPEALALPLATDLRQLQTVFAGGYPGLALRSDAELGALMQGDTQAAPQASLTRGEVMVLQMQDSGVPLILHQAFITSGNSGGPLVDACGRVVGVNTFVAAESQGARGRINYALGSAALQSFLSSQGIEVAAADSPCVPGVARQPGDAPAVPNGDEPDTTPESPAEATPETAPEDTGEATQ